MDSGGGDVAAIVTTVDHSTSIISAAHNEVSSDSWPPPVVVEDDDDEDKDEKKVDKKKTDEKKIDEKKVDVPELGGRSIDPQAEFESRLARFELLLARAAEPDPRIARLEATLARRLDSGNDITDEKGATVREHVAAFEDKVEPSPGPSSPRRMFSRPMWGTMKRGTDTVDGRVPNMDFKIPNVDINIDGYFMGPRALDKHSKWPTFMRLHGTITPKMLLPMTIITFWSILVTAISQATQPLGVPPLLLTILGFVVGLSLSFRGATAYERYMEGRRAWATLTVQTRNIGRYIWVHVRERQGEEGKADLMAKITAINLLHALAVSLKHQLRFEPYTYYPDMTNLVGHLDTFAKAAEHPALHEPRGPISKWKAVGEYLGVNMATSNPRKPLKRAMKPLGNLPYEIMLDMSAYFEMASNNGTMHSGIIYGQVFNAMAIVTDTIATANRVLATPLPIGYATLISQIVVLYVYCLPFQLSEGFGWKTIPATMVAAYILLGLEAMGTELENPFGNSPNDLPLDSFCDEIRRDLDVVMSSYRADGTFEALMKKSERSNKVLWPLSNSPEGDWKQRSKEEIMSALKAKVVVGETRRLSADRQSEERAMVILPI